MAEYSIFLYRVMKGVRSSQFPRVSTATFVLKNGKTVRIFPNTKTKRMYAKLRGGKWNKVYFKVEYGKAKSDDGKFHMFYDDYEGTNPKEAVQAFKAFLERP